MKKLLCLMVAASLSFSGAATWKQLPTASFLKRYYMAPTSGTTHRALETYESSAGDVSITGAFVLFAQGTNKALVLNCVEYRYTGELQDTFTFQFSRAGATNTTPDPVHKSNFDIIDGQTSFEDKMAMALTTCGLMVENPITIYAPSRFGALSLAGGFSDVTVKLVRLTGVGIRAEFTP